MFFFINKEIYTLIPFAISIALRPRILFQLKSIDSNVSLPPIKISMNSLD
jgi:hypothetical protein